MTYDQVERELYPIERYQAPKLLHAEEMEDHAHRWLHGIDKYVDAGNDEAPASSFLSNVCDMPAPQPTLAGPPCPVGALSATWYRPERMPPPSPDDSLPRVGR